MIFMLIACRTAQALVESQFVVNLNILTFKVVHYLSRRLNDFSVNYSLYPEFCIIALICEVMGKSGDTDPASVESQPVAAINYAIPRRRASTLATAGADGYSTIPSFCTSTPASGYTANAKESAAVKVGLICLTRRNPAPNCP